MRSKLAAVLLVLSSVALMFGSTTLTASAATSVHAELAVQAASIPFGLIGFSSLVVLLGLIGLVVGLTRLGRRFRAEKRAAAKIIQIDEQPGQAGEPARTAA
jgi:hypothetical protein